MICPKCRAKEHGLCPGGTWCDCQHRTKSIWPPASSESNAQLTAGSDLAVNVAIESAVSSVGGVE